MSLTPIQVQSAIVIACLAAFLPCIQATTTTYLNTYYFNGPNCTGELTVSFGTTLPSCFGTGRGPSAQLYLTTCSVANQTVTDTPTTTCYSGDINSTDTGSALNVCSSGPVMVNPKLASFIENCSYIEVPAYTTSNYFSCAGQISFPFWLWGL